MCNVNDFLCRVGRFSVGSNSSLAYDCYKLDGKFHRIVDSSLRAVEEEASAGDEKDFTLPESAAERAPSPMYSGKTWMKLNHLILI